MASSEKAMTFLENIKRLFLESKISLFTITKKALIEFQSRIDGKMRKRRIQYLKTNGKLLGLCKRGADWWKELISGAPVNVFIGKEKFSGWAEIVDDPDRLKGVWNRINEKLRKAIDQVVFSESETLANTKSNTHPLNDLIVVEIHIP